MPRFLDTNVLLRYFTGTPLDQAERAHRLLGRIERGEERAVTSVMVVFETVFTLERTYKVPKQQIREKVEDILSPPSLVLSGKRLLLQALEFYALEPRLSFADAYNSLFMREQGLTEIYTWDRDFDRVPGISRIEPAD